MGTSPLTAQLLAILYHSPNIHQAWKDELGDRLLDAYQAGSPLTSTDILKFLHHQHPSVLQRLTRHPLVRNEIAALLSS